jgi:hypothetical protein
VVGRRWSFDGTERTGTFMRIVTEEVDRAEPPEPATAGEPRG